MPQQQCHKTLSKTKTKTKTKTKNGNDQTCAIFSESRGCKDIKYDILSASIEPHRDKDKDKNKDKDKVQKRLYMWHIFEKKRVQGYQN